MKKLFLRIKFAYMILFKYNHFCFFVLKEKDFMNFLLNDTYEVHGGYLGMREYHKNLMIKNLSESVDGADLILSKADYQADLHEIITKL